MTHKECNPQMMEKNRQPGGLRLHEWKVPMGLSQSDLRSLPESIQAAASADSRRVLSGLRLQPQIRHSTTQWPSVANMEIGARHSYCFFGMEWGQLRLTHICRQRAEETNHSDRRLALELSSGFRTLGMSLVRAGLGAAVADLISTGLISAAHCNDLINSFRNPAACCGVDPK